jgi:tight adherence protein C
MTIPFAAALLAGLTAAAGVDAALALWPDALDRRVRALASGPVRAGGGGDGLKARLSARLSLWAARRPVGYDKAAELCQQAGWRHHHAPALLLIARRWLALAAPLIGAPWALAADNVPLAFLGLAAAGWAAPRLAQRNATIHRLQRLEAALPDAIDLLVICAEAGLSLDVALGRVGRELAPAAPDLAAELALAAVELGFLPHRADAFANLAKRAPLPMLDALAHLLAQTERYGTPLAQGLRVLAAEFRTGRMLRAEERAAKLPALMTLPMIGFILPPLFIVLIGPAIIGVLGAH